jgi:hypothetical protein
MIAAQQAQELKSTYMSTTRTGPFFHSSAITPDPNQLQSAPDSAVVDVIYQAAIAACQIWHVPPSWIYIAMSGQNVTCEHHAGRRCRAEDSVDVFYRRFEKIFSLCLIDPQVVRVNRDAVLKMDAPTRVDVQAKRSANKLMSVNGRPRAGRRAVARSDLRQAGATGAPEVLRRAPSDRRRRGVPTTMHRRRQPH